MNPAESGFYYLESRYYDPETGRFINADDVSYLGADGSVLSYNLYVYCKNNPINGSDPTGHWSWKDVFKTATIVTVAALAVAAIVMSGGSAAPPLLAAASAVAGTAVSAGTVATAATGVAIGGFATMGVAAAASIYEASSGKNNQYDGKSTYNKEGQRIDYEYYGNGNGNVHYDGTKGKEILWRLQDGLETTYKVSKAVSKIISPPSVQ